MNAAACRFYLQLLREGRESAQKDSENYGALVRAFELIGRMEKDSSGNGLGAYRHELLKIAEGSILSNGKPAHLHIDSKRLFELIKEQRNDAVHQGVVARNLVRHAVEFSIILENAIMNSGTLKYAEDFMVRDVTYADWNHPMSYTRQRMLMNAFSFLPVIAEDGTVKVLGDVAFAKWLCKVPYQDRKRAIMRSLKEILADTPVTLVLDDPVLLPHDVLIDLVVEKMRTTPVLLHEPGNTSRIVGIITASDLL